MSDNPTVAVPINHIGGPPGFFLKISWQIKYGCFLYIIIFGCPVHSFLAKKYQS